MNHSILVQLGIFLIVLGILAYPLGSYIERVMQGEMHFLSRVLGPIERAIYRLSGIDAKSESGWKPYALALLAFNFLGVLVVYALQRLQIWLPFNPQNMPAPSPDSAFNTAISFVSNTNWQSYSGESSMSYLTQMLGLTVQNFFSAATGIVVVIALIRGFARHSSKTVGNFYVDLVRSTLYILLPLSIVFAALLMGQGVIQNFAAYQTAELVEVQQYQAPVMNVDGKPRLDANGAAVTETKTQTTQSLPMGPVASQEAVKLLGTNGGGFFNANSAHPFENPTPLSNFMQMIAIFLLPAALCFSFGRMIGNAKQGWVILLSMSILFITFAVFAMLAEQQANPGILDLGIDQSLGNMEGKESRFGTTATALFAAITTSASCGAVNGMHDSFTPLGGLVPMVLMQLGEVVFGGVGSGLYGMLIFAILAVFIAGLMIGRTPEYLGKKIEAYEMKMVALAILITPLLVLGFSALAVIHPDGLAGLANPGAHGFSEILYAYSSAANNNGSAFAGLSANTPFYNISTAIAMWCGRFWIIVPVLAIAGSLAQKKRLQESAGTLPTQGPLFVVLLVGTVLIVGALTYIPALSLGPIIEHFMLLPK
ncbi:potassium-transporting ATPase subunit KdpA [Undibacterium cyanobacteriorum]|uniref:Potassium-transporting ATPase potassium-binding subunit n=1 Tax=Undibacterium cyanobacteriorum TaxID=3073561 RepID=A0ABY9RLX0_9BURK|nr:potassium-transporting ATPase subunit KdpA [Undibacterium sp. 20NA77.5]WMW81868.1 potassium-transporting ATPase subunit KdpA [Undibacterium sp. 20NA77.5]